MKTLTVTIVALFSASSLFLPRALDPVHLEFDVPQIPRDVRRADDCAQYALYATLANTGHQVDLDDFRTMLAAKHAAGGTSMQSIVKMAWPWTVLRYHPTGSTRHLHEELVAGRPVMVVTMWPSEGRTSFGHGMVVTGYGQQTWTIADSRGKFDVSHDLFDSVWTGQWFEASIRRK